MKGFLDHERAAAAARIELQKAQMAVDDRPHEALQCLLAACRLDPESPEIALCLGRLQVRLGRHGDALESLNRALALTEMNDEVLGLSALCHFKLGNFDRAKARAGAAVEMNAGNLAAREVLADCHRAQGVWGEAVHCLRHLLDQEGQTEGAYARQNLKLAQCLLKMGEHTQAWDITEKLLSQGYGGEQVEAVHRACEIRNQGEVRTAFGRQGLAHRAILWIAKRHILKAISIGRRAGAEQGPGREPGAKTRMRQEGSL